MNSYLSRRFPEKTFLRSLSFEERQIVLAEDRARSPSNGKTIMVQDRHEPMLFAILSGFVMISRIPELGREPRFLDIYGPGDLLGLDNWWLGLNMNYMCVTVGEHVEVAVISGDHLLGLFAEHRRISEVVVSTAFRQLRWRDKLASYSGLTVQERLVGVLRHLALRHGEPTGGGLMVEIPLTNKHYAHVAGASLRTIGNELQKLEKNGNLRHGPLHYHWFEKATPADTTPLGKSCQSAGQRSR